MPREFKKATPSMGFTFSATGRKILKRDVKFSSQGNISIVDQQGQNGATPNSVKPEGFGQGLQAKVL